MIIQTARVMWSTEGSVALLAREDVRYGLMIGYIVKGGMRSAVSTSLSL